MEIREGHNKFYINDEQGKQIAEIVFVPTGENLAIIEHTDVDESLKGQGIGKQLVAKVVEKMRREKRKIIPLCPFAKHELKWFTEFGHLNRGDMLTSEQHRCHNEKKKFQRRV